MLFERASEKLKKFNKYGLHYNLVAEAAYERLKHLESPFNNEYRPYITAALISFDMGRMMGRGLEQKYDSGTEGFASKLSDKLSAIRSDIEPLSSCSISDIEIEDASKSIKKSYRLLSINGKSGLHSRCNFFHVGATKILHFINPTLFPIIDSNAAKTLKAFYGMPYRNTTQPGYSADLYIRSMITIKSAVSEFGADRFQALEPETPLLRIFDKLTFAWGNSW